jgi:hypothetical protein
LHFTWCIAGSNNWTHLPAYPSGWLAGWLVSDAECITAVSLLLLLCVLQVNALGKLWDLFLVRAAAAALL